MTEMAERAQLISQEAGTKVAAAMKDVISAAAGIAGFAVESARDLVQFMVRRGQMTQDEADKLIREAEAHGKRGGKATGKAAAPSASASAAERAPKSEAPRKEAAAAKSPKKEPSKRDSAAKKSSSKPATKKRR
ncbi:MAG TPA: putative porin [Gemmatimonadaceae bacterium]|nr:putative porin [Gemmatimonadaceae bacterium]